MDKALLEYFYGKAEEILDHNGLEKPDVNGFLDAEKLCEDIIGFCKECYTDSEKMTEEFFITSYFATICLTIYHIKDEKSYTRDMAFPFLQTKCDTEFCDVYADRLLGYQRNSVESDSIWLIFRPYVGFMLDYTEEYGELSDDVLKAAMEPAIAIGIAVAEKYYEPSGEAVSEFVGKHIDVEALIGRNYYHYVNGTKAEEQPFTLSINDIDLDDEEEEGEEGFLQSASLSAYIPRDCWIKRLSASEENRTENLLVVIELDDEFNVLSVSEVLEVIQQVGRGLFMIPGMSLPARRIYRNQICLSEEVEEEMTLLLKRRFIPRGFSLLGKKLPQRMIDEDDDSDEDFTYSIALPSAYRQAYVHLSIDTSQEGIIEDFEYSTYQSTGSAYGDMFSRPVLIGDMREEMIDAVLAVIDKYSEEEYNAVLTA